MRQSDQRSRIRAVEGVGQSKSGGVVLLCLSRLYMFLTLPPWESETGIFSYIYKNLDTPKL
jgi:hypothetical protein